MKNEFILPSGISLRLANSNDGHFLFTLFCSARTEFAFLPLPKAQLEQLLRQQYEWQQQGYASQHPDSNDWIIESPAGPVGKVMLFQSSSLLHIIDFIIAPDWRNQGIGSTVLGALKKYVASNSCVLRLSVDRQNFHAKRLYLREGFIVNQTSETHEQLLWSAINQ